jgi:hypothetical protein
MHEQHTMLSPMQYTAGHKIFQPDDVSDLPKLSELCVADRGEEDGGVGD